MQRIVIIGAGFAGLWSALSAARLLDLEGKADGEIEIVLVAPEPRLVMRPRLYEADAAGMSVALQPLLDVAGVRYVQGMAEEIRPESRELVIRTADAASVVLAYDKLVVASGSVLHRPNLPGLEHAFSIDQLEDAAALDIHLGKLARQPRDAARDTVVIAGGGFTGIELAAEMPARLRATFGEPGGRVVIVERAASIGPDLGPGPRPVIERALRDLGVEVRTAAELTSLDANGLVLSTGERIASRTIVWTAGLRAAPLTARLPAERDALGRLKVDRDLRIVALPDIFAAGDAAYAATDDEGHHALMSCQHALMLGRFAGNNAAADLLGRPTRPYAQPRYVTCLDLGPWGAVVTEGWTREVQQSGAEAKAFKQFINGQLIYPPDPDRAAALAAANPDQSL